MPETPSSDSAARTSSSLNGLMMAVISFMQRLALGCRPNPITIRATEEIVSSSIVVIGAGQAGAQAIETLRRQGYDGTLTLVGDEPHVPYQRPPLSKKFLSGELAEDRLPIKHRPFYDEHRVELKLGQAVT